MQSFELACIGDVLEHEKTEGQFELSSINPAVLTRTLKLATLRGWYAQGPRGVLIELLEGGVKRGDILRSKYHQGEFVVIFATENLVLVNDTRQVDNPDGWWVATPGKK